MGRVDEIMLQLEGKKSPFIHLLEGVAGGVQTAQNHALERAKAMLEMEERQQKMQHDAMIQKEIKKQIDAQNEADLKRASGDPTAVLPKQKIKRISEFGPGGYSQRVEVVDAEPEAEKLPGSTDEALAWDYARGKITREQLLAEKRRLATASNTKPEGKMLPPNTVLALNEGKNVARLMPDVEKAIKQSLGKYGPTSFIDANNPYNEDAQTLDAQIRTASQAFGRFMEGGVLRKEDEEKYRKMFPNLRDTDAVKKNKLAIVRRMLASKYEDDRKTLGASGYDVSGFGALEIPASLFDEAEQEAGAVAGESAGKSKTPGKTIQVGRFSVTEQS